MIPSLAAMVRVSLRRSRASWPIVAAAGLICLLASSLMAAGPMYAGAVSLAGLHRVLADAPVTDANVGVSFRVDPPAWSDADAVVTHELDRAVGSVGGAVQRYGVSDSFDLRGGPSAPLTDLVTLGFLDGIEGHADLAAGAWPAVAPDHGGTVAVAIADTVAGRLGLSVGAELRLPNRASSSFVVPVRVVGIYHVRDPADPFWWSDAQLIEGLTTSERFATHGPFMTTRAAFLASAGPGRIEVGWRAFPRADGFATADTGPVSANVQALDSRLEAALPGTRVTVQTGLPAILADADRALLVGRTGVLLLTAQFVILAAYAVLLSAALLVEHRRTDTAMLRSRGAGPARIGLLSLLEGVLLVVPAAVLGPVVAAIGLRVLNVVGPLADIGLAIDPVVSGEAFVASGLAALACLLALMIPALPRIRSFTAVHAGVGRAETRTAGQRFGLDIVLLTLAALGLWQLRHYGAPLTRSVQGALGIDPLLVATPAIGFLAGAVLALRVVPRVASVIERVAARRTTLVPSLGARQLARRPLRYTRAALLLMLAVSMGVFAITYTRTWRESQDDQAQFQVGADVRVVPGRRTVDPPAWSLDALYAAVPGITQRMPVRMSSIRVPRSDASGTMVAVDAAVAGGIVRTRPDMVAGTLTDVVGPLAAQRPRVGGVPLPDGTRRFALDVQLETSKLQTVTVDPETGEERVEDADPQAIGVDAGLTARIVVRDARGTLIRSSGRSAGSSDDLQRVEIALRPPDRADAEPAYPLELLAIELSLAPSAPYTIAAATIAVVGVQASAVAAPTTGDWADVDLALANGWRTTASVYNLPHQDVGHVITDARLALAVPDAKLPMIGSADEFGRGTLVTFASADLIALQGAALPAVATARYLEATGRSLGDEVAIDVGGVQRDVRLAGTVEAFPTVTPGTPALIVDLPTLALHRFEATGAVDPPDAWWFAVAPGMSDDVAARLRDPSIGSAAVVTLAERTRSLAADPVALGVIGALGIGIVAAAAFAIIGFVVSASVSARERVGEFALLRALGLSARQLSGWLSLENATLAVISLVAGTALGLLVAWVALPFVTVTQRAEPPFPPVVVSVPWSTIALLDLAGIAALSITIVALTWSLARVALASTLRKGEE